MRFVVLGGGPAGHQAATLAARLGAEVTVVERDIVGGAAHLWDCIPSKTMIATGAAISFARGIEGMGLSQVTDPSVHVDALAARVEGIKDHLHGDIVGLLHSQGGRILTGAGRFTGSHSIQVDGPDGSTDIEFDAALVSTGSRPRIPD